MNEQPLVSVVMAVLNGGRLLKKSIESILEQSYLNIQLVIVDDGSQDDTLDVIKSFSDERIKLLVNEQNMGLIYSLNYGVNNASGELIARMDADDIALPQRIAKQVNSFNDDEHRVVVGSWLTLVNERECVTGEWQYPESNAAIKWNQLFNSGIAHPSVMFKKKAFLDSGGYSLNHKYAEDYELWTRLGNKGQLYNIQESLVLYRVHDASISQVSSVQQDLARKKISKHNIKELLRSCHVEDETEILVDPYNSKDSSDLQIVINLRGHFQEIEKLNKSEIMHIDAYVVAMAMRLLTKSKFREKVFILKLIIASTINLIDKCKFIVKFFIRLK